MEKRLKIEPFTPQSSVPAFLLKLRSLVDDSENDYLIKWDSSGESFHLYDQVLFAKEVLPKYFKHNNLASFVRQLNMYGFKKISSIDQGALQSKEDMEFQNQYFIRDQPELMELIKRKQSTIKEKIIDYGALMPTQVDDVLVDIKTLKHSQNDINEQLAIIKRENSVLWREIASLRQKHVQQQHIINKLIQFLMTIASSRRGLKRQLPMIEHVPSKKPSTVPVASDRTLQTNNVMTTSARPLNSKGITIKDITDNDPDFDLFPNAIDTDIETGEPLYLATDVSQSSTSSINSNTIPSTIRNSPIKKTLAPSQASTQTIPRYTQNTPTSTTVDASDTLPIATSSQDATSIVPSSDLLHFKDDLSDNISVVQTDIDVLRDLFSGESFGLPQDAIHTLFDGNNESIPSLNIREEDDSLIDLDELLERTSDKSRTNVLEAVPTTLPDDLDSLICPATTTANPLSNGDLNDMININPEQDIHQPIISSHDLD